MRGCERAARGELVAGSGDTVRVTLPPTIKATQADATRILVALDGLPATPFGLEVAIERVPNGSDSSCRFKQTSEIARNSSRSAPVEVMPQFPFTRFCSGSYGATLESANGSLASDTFTIP